MSFPKAQTVCEDLLYLIFLHALPSKFERNRSFTDVGAVEPLNLSMVCRSWHSAIQSHPSLWSHTTINDYQDDQVRSSLLPYFSQRLQHSKSSPLSISLFLHRQEEDDPVVKGIIEATLAQDFRLKDVEICIENPCMEQPFILPFSSSLVSLELSFRRSFGAPPLSKFAASPDFTSCHIGTNLQKLSICSGIVRWILPKYPCDVLLFPGLTKLGICTNLNDNVDDFYVVLSACPNIAHLTVQACCPSSSTTSACISAISDPVVLPHLTHLRICSEDRSAMLQLLDKLTCPSLRKFWVSTGQSSFRNRNFEDHSVTLALLASYSEFFNRSKPPLLSLSFEYPRTPPSNHGHGRALSNMLRPLRTLESLDLCNVAIDAELLDEMAFHNQEGHRNSAICPMLMEIRIFYHVQTIFSRSVIERKQRNDLVADNACAHFKEDRVSPSRLQELEREHFGHTA